MSANGPPSDCRVHAVLANGTRVVRYERAGKWYAEGGPLQRRHPLTLRQASGLACVADAEVRFGVPGGSAFDRQVRKFRSDDA